MFKRDLEFLLKEKYGYSDTEIFLAKLDAPTPSSLKGLPFFINKDIKLLKKCYPVDYLIGYKWFLGNKIDLSKKPLIPRNETEDWVEKCIKQILGNNLFCENNANKRKSLQKIEILDIFCGSGCIGIGVLRHVENAFVTFSDVSLKATKQCVINLLDKKGNPFYGVGSPNERRHKVIRSNLFEKMKRAKFDYIFANPPYVDLNDPLIGEEIKYEPTKALFADDNGMAIIKKFLAEAHKHLLPNGQIFMEFGYNQKDLIDEYLKSLNLYKKWRFHKDQHQNWRWVEIG